MAMARVLLIVAAVGGLTAWVIAQGTTMPSAPATAPSAAPRRDRAALSATVARDPDFDVEVSRLREGLGVMPGPSPSGRNPFRFGAARVERPVSTGSHHSAAPVAGGSAADAAPDRPPMQLLGVAADGDETGAAPVRTAVIATPRQLYLVKEGEQMALRFQVVRIGSDVVELRDLATDQTFSLALR